MENVYHRSYRGASMFYSVLLTMAADAKLFEIRFKGVTQRDAVRTLTLMKFAAAKLQI
jgi:hypothetical protein